MTLTVVSERMATLGRRKKKKPALTAMKRSRVKIFLEHENNVSVYENASGLLLIKSIGKEDGYLCSTSDFTIYLDKYFILGIPNLVDRS